MSKTARVVGNLTSLLVLLKGLPLAYNRDLQEDKPPIFDSYDAVDACLELAAPLIAETRLNGEAIAAGLDHGYLDATTLMEYLIERGVAQRTAHHAVGTLVRGAMQRGLPLKELPLAEFQEICAEVDESVFARLGARSAVDAFRSFGSSAPQEVDRQIRDWQSRLAKSTTTSAPT